MLLVRRSNIPNYLRCSEFYKSLDVNEEEEEEGGEIPIPECNLKFDLHLDSEYDLYHLLSTLRFWGVESIPKELINFIFTRELEDFEDILDEFGRELTYLHVIQRVSDEQDDHKMNAAIESHV